MSYLTDRRRFLKSTALTGVGVFVAGKAAAEDSKSPNERIRFACIGVGGKGTQRLGRRQEGTATSWPSATSTTTRWKRPVKSFPKAAKYNDFRKMLDEMGKSIDAVTVSTPDHMHAPGVGHGDADGQGLLHAEAADAHDLGSPQAGRDRRERRSPRRWATRAPPSTRLRKTAAVGPLRRGGQRQGSSRLDQSSDLAARRRSSGRSAGARRTCTGICGSAVLPIVPTLPAIIPFAWRGWWDFGSGALGDMACHTVNMPFMALEPARPDGRAGRDLGPQSRQLSEVVDHQVRLPGQRQPPGRAR